MLVVGGSRGLTGAPSLAAEAAFRADAGYVAVAVPDSTLPVFEQRLLEAVKLPCPEDEGKISPRAIEPIVEFTGKAGAVALAQDRVGGTHTACQRVTASVAAASSAWPGVIVAGAGSLRSGLSVELR